MINWITKYTPKTLDDYIGNKLIIDQLQDWLIDFENHKSVKKCALLYGSSGIGKTSLAYLLLKNLIIQL